LGGPRRSIDYQIVLIAGPEVEICGPDVWNFLKKTLSHYLRESGSKYRDALHFAMTTWSRVFCLVGHGGQNFEVYFFHIYFWFSYKYDII
jgi:hypothetical protein